MSGHAGFDTNAMWRAVAASSDALPTIRWLVESIVKRTSHRDHLDKRLVVECEQDDHQISIKIIVQFAEQTGWATYKYSVDTYEIRRYAIAAREYAQDVDGWFYALNSLKASQTRRNTNLNTFRHLHTE